MDFVVGGYSVSCYLSLLLERSKKKNIWQSPEFLVYGFKICITDTFTFSSYKTSHQISVILNFLFPFYSNFIFHSGIFQVTLLLKKIVISLRGLRMQLRQDTVEWQCQQLEEAKQRYQYTHLISISFRSIIGLTYGPKSIRCFPLYSRSTK